MYRLTCLIKQYEKYQSRPTSEFETEMSKIFDDAKSDGEWLCKENKKLYKNQVKSNGSFEYATNKKAPLSIIHLSKRKLLKKPFNESFEHSTTMLVQSKSSRI